MIGLTAMRFAIHIIVSQHKKIERYKGVIKLLEKDVAEAKEDAAKEFAKFPFHNCPSCNTVVSEHNKFCSECGQKLDWSDTE